MKTGLLIITHSPLGQALHQVATHVLGGEPEGVAYTKDISVNGLFLKTRQPLEEGSRLQLAFDLPAADQPTIRVDAEVVRVVAPDRDSHLIPGAGLRFRGISERDRLDIAGYVAAGPGGEA